MKGMDGLVSSKTVVGDAVRVDNITILPLIDVSFGIGAGSNLSDKKDKGMGGVGGKITLYRRCWIKLRPEKKIR